MHFQPPSLVGLVSGILIHPEQLLRMQELFFGHLFANCGFLACVLLFCENWNFRVSPEPGPEAGR